ncbi:MAG: malate dehydrogenase [Isosphaeraceae bacterium]
MTTPIRVSITGAAGQIGYAILFRVASGGLFGPDQPVALSLLDVDIELPQPDGSKKPMREALGGTVMELDDCAFPLLTEVSTHFQAPGSPDMSATEAAFAGADWVILVGGLPRKKGMSRADLIRANGPIFTGQGKAINDAAGPNVRILTVANPCNTNALIARSHAPKVPADRWFAMTRLDQNRAASQLAQKAGVPVAKVTRMAIWGNHSDTQYPDFKNALIGGKPATEVITDHAWFPETFVPTVAKRGAAVIAARGASSAASAANAAIDSVRSASFPTAAGDWFSAGVVSDGSYGVPAGLIYSFPLTSADGKSWKIVQGLPIDADAKARIDASAQELITERNDVKDLLGPAA